MSTSKLTAITDLHDLRGKYVLVRSALNVPIDDGEIRNHFRLIRSLPTLEWLVRQGAKVMVCGHIGREKENTLKPVYEYLRKSLQADVLFSPEVVGPVTKNLREGLEEGHVLVLENLRRDPRELQNDDDFARSLADLCDVYVNDAFDVSHREQASVVGVPKFVATTYGINFIREYDEISKALEPQHPSVFILGGAKFDTKLPLIEKFLDLYDHVVVGGALANDVYKARGLRVGRSLVSDTDLSDNPIINHEKLIVAKEVIVANPQGERRVTPVEDVQADESILDAGPDIVSTLELFTRNAKTVLWNGPLGNYEGGYEDQTLAVAKLLAECPADTIIGGGDTVAAIESLNNFDKYTFVSTAGGAMLTYLEHGTLPVFEIKKFR